MHCTLHVTYYNYMYMCKYSLAVLVVTQWLYN